jgi:tetrahydromethanopterin S-methyltransferase subunit B
MSAKSYATSIPPLISDLESALNAVVSSSSPSSADIDSLDAKKGVVIVGIFFSCF